MKTNITADAGGANAGGDGAATSTSASATDANANVNAAATTSNSANAVNAAANANVNAAANADATDGGVVGGAGAGAGSGGGGAGDTTNSPCLIEGVVRALECLRARCPLTHCMTNGVVKEFTANVLLAVGASPAMIEHAEEAREFATMADALLVNLGTLDDAQMEAMRGAIPAYRRAGKPWVLDPVAVGALGVRTRFAREIAGCQPALIRGNASEIIGLCGRASRGRGTDSGDGAEEALDAARELAARTGAVVLATGAVDYATDGARVRSCANGHVWMTRVTGAGCAQGALAAAFAAVCGERLVAALAAAVVMAVAGESAAARTAGPGGFRVALVDELSRIDGESLRRRARVA
ncbi:MAG: hydroxyethylthiazole kinase [Opitutaceae bacterium]|jgi:hydroxyethylthiazole kinase|nr:hydroxyethylthiazole kinase [Opitutaceae bacterium]